MKTNESRFCSVNISYKLCNAVGVVVLPFQINVLLISYLGQWDINAMTSGWKAEEYDWNKCKK